MAPGSKSWYFDILWCEKCLDTEHFPSRSGKLDLLDESRMKLVPWNQRFYPFLENTVFCYCKNIQKQTTRQKFSHHHQQKSRIHVTSRKHITFHQQKSIHVQPNKTTLMDFACFLLPICQRNSTDFCWQRKPYLWSACRPNLFPRRYLTKKTDVVLLLLLILGSNTSWGQFFPIPSKERNITYIQPWEKNTKSTQKCLFFKGIFVSSRVRVIPKPGWCSSWWWIPWHNENYSL